MTRLTLALLAFFSFIGISHCHAQGAMVYGTDAASSPDSVILPTTNDYWFTQGNGVNIPASQVTSYWLNKVGGEINYAITTSGQTLSMTSYTQLWQAMENAASATETQSTIGGGITWEKLPSGKIFFRGPVTIPGSTLTVTVTLPIPPGQTTAFPHAFRGGIASDAGTALYTYSVEAGASLNQVTVNCQVWTVNQSNGTTINRNGAAGGFFEAWGD